LGGRNYTRAIATIAIGKRFGVEEALKAYTLGASCTAGTDDRQGKFTQGYQFS